LPFCFSNFSIQAEPAGRIIIKVQFTCGVERKGNEEQEEERKNKKE
jgi:hypothetical protein